MSFKLAHISDIHLGPLPDPKLRELASKRITGYVNWKRNRGHAMGGDALAHIVSAMKAARPDHVAVTGDLVNLALDSEIEVAGIWLEGLGNPFDTSVVPGNHDAYVRGALHKAKVRWAPFMAGDDPQKPSTVNFPYLRVRDDVALIGINSAVATPPFVAAGRFGTQQARHLRKMLQNAGARGLFRLVLIHHPPVRNATIPAKRLYGIGLFQSVIREAGAELVLHGHTHLSQRHLIDGFDGAKVPVIGVPSASQAPGGRKPAAAYNMIEITRDAGHWTVDLKAHSLSGPMGATHVTDTQSWTMPRQGRS